jgi:hypothetical protein
MIWLVPAIWRDAQPRHGTRRGLASDPSGCRAERHRR